MSIQSHYDILSEDRTEVLNHYRELTYDPSEWKRLRTRRLIAADLAVDAKLIERRLHSIGNGYWPTRHAVDVHVNEPAFRPQLILVGREHAEQIDDACCAHTFGGQSDVDCNRKRKLAQESAGRFSNNPHGFG